MSSEVDREFPALVRPPIVEVVCGVVFDSVPDLDALVLGVYWDSRKNDYPKRSLQPALTDEDAFSIGLFPLRALLTSEDDQFVLQLQHDRFFMNWRATGSQYPRFSERHRAGGLLMKAIEEYDRFCGFVRGRFGVQPLARRIELTKIDLLQRGEHWQDLEDLATLVPVTSVSSGIQKSEGREVDLRFVERAGNGTTVVHIATRRQDETSTALRIETRHVSDAQADILAAFHRANGALNEVFFKLIADAHHRFGVKDET